MYIHNLNFHIIIERLEKIPIQIITCLKKLHAGKGRLELTPMRLVCAADVKGLLGAPAYRL